MLDYIIVGIFIVNIILLAEFLYKFFSRPNVNHKIVEISPVKRELAYGMLLKEFIKHANEPARIIIFREFLKKLESEPQDFQDEMAKYGGEIIDG